MAEEGSTIDIDGSIMEGGGQILRICTALSCLLGLRVRVMKIRAGRSTPGLRPQHLSGLETVRDLCCGQLENAHIGSTEINFAPGRIKGGALTADTKTAGSVCLLLQVSLPCVLFAESPCELIFKGGTNAEMAPQIDYTTMAFSEHINSVGTDITFTRKETTNSKTHFLDCVACQGKGDLDIEVYRKPTYTDQYPPFDFHHPMEHKRGVIRVLQHQTEMVFKPAAERFGFKLDCDIRKRGYYPRGGGEILVRVSPIKYLKPINLTDRGTITKIYGRAFVAGVLPYKMVKDMISAAVRCIRRELRDLYVNIQGVQEPADKAVGNGSGIIIVAETSTGCIFAGSSLGKKGVTADRVGAEAAEILLRNLRHGGCVDEYLQDQLIIFMALADGVSQIRTGPLTLHTQTAIHFTEQLTKAKFTVTKCDEPNTDSNIIECQGTGLQNKNAS